MHCVMPSAFKKMVLLFVKGLLRRFLSILLLNSAMTFKESKNLAENSIFYWKNGTKLKTPGMSQVLHAGITSNTVLWNVFITEVLK